MYMTVLALCEPMATYISARLGAKRMHHSYDVEYQILKMKDTSLPRLIQKHFNLTDDLLQPPTYFRYILTYFLFLRI